MKTYKKNKTYLNKIFCCLGAYRLRVETMTYMDTAETTENKLKKAIDYIQKYMSGEVKFQIKELQNQLFREYKANFALYPKSSYEYQYWLGHGFFECENLQEVYEYSVHSDDYIE